MECMQFEGVVFTESHTAKGIQPQASPAGAMAWSVGQIMAQELM